MKSIQIDITVSVPVDGIWKAWTQEDRITKWFSPEANIEAREGGPFELFFDPSNHDHECTKGCIFTHVEPNKKLGFTWRGPNQFEDLMNHPDSLTTVLVSFDEEDTVTRVHVEHNGWGDGELWEKAREWHKKAWKGVLSNLKRTLETDKEK
jgi:uncharacterized protein YndB with AHSA1/START domain